MKGKRRPSLLEAQKSFTKRSDHRNICTLFISKLAKWITLIESVESSEKDP